MTGPRLSAVGVTVPCPAGCSWAHTPPARLGARAAGLDLQAAVLGHLRGAHTRDEIAAALETAELAQLVGGPRVHRA